MLQANLPIVEMATTHGSVPELPSPGPRRIALYGDSLASESAQDFAFLAESARGLRCESAPSLARQPCDYLASMAADAQDWQPIRGDAGIFRRRLHPVHGGCPDWNVAVLHRSTRTIPRRPPRSSGLWAPRSSWSACPLMPLASLSQNSSGLNQIYQSLTENNPGVTYDDAGRPFRRADGSPGPSAASQVSRAPGQTGQTSSHAPDGVHFCPNGETTLIAGFKNAMSIRRALSDLPRPCWPRPSLQVVSPRP